MADEFEQLREGIYSLNTRRFGTVAELIIKKLANLSSARSQFHDLYDDLENHRVEVKFSRVLKKADIKITLATVYKCIVQATSEHRLVPYSNWKAFEFDCNIQQIKRTEFDILYYGLFFSDKVLVFRIATKDIGEQINYSDKQHKGNVGEGQFHINQDTLNIHVENYLHSTLTYAELNKMLKPES